MVPTVGRPSLAVLLEALAAGGEPLPGAVLVVDDRRDRSAPLPLAAPARLADRLRVVDGPGRGPAAARNVGWRTAAGEWVAFLDDDVVPGPRWLERLAADLGAAGPGLAGSQGRLRVPLPADRRPTDWERNVAGLEGARWATADLAYRRAVLEEVGGFDERFPRAYREDADLGLRVVAAGHRIEVGGRESLHPVGPADRWVSVRLQAGNRDDVLMRALHGPRWRAAAGAPPGRLRRHLAVTFAGVTGVAGLVSGRPRLARAGLLGWLVGTAELAWARVAPGPRTADEVATVVATSCLLPGAATLHRLAGLALFFRPGRGPNPGEAGTPTPPAALPFGPGRGPNRRRRSRRRQAAGPFSSHGDAAANQPDVVDFVGAAGLLGEAGTPTPPAAVLLDRDGTLVADVPYNADPEQVVPLPGARSALDRLRAAGVPLAVVSNQSGVARGLVTLEQLEAVNRRVEDLLGPLGPWLVCVHGAEDGCACRKPAPGLIQRAADALGVDPSRCAVVGDIGADVEAARAAGARAVLVPTPATRPEEVAAAPEVAEDLEAAVDLLMGGGR